MTWNYRRTTWVQNPSKKGKEAGQESVRMFGITEVYYNDEGKPCSWIDNKNILNWSSQEDLESTYEMIDKAFKLPVLDLDSYKRKTGIITEWNN